MPGKVNTHEKEEMEMGKALGVWMKRNNVRVADLRRKMDWSYNYTWMVARGKTPFRREAWGTFIAGFGMPAFSDILRAAGIKIGNNGES